jgi:hypothetical protein
MTTRACVWKSGSLTIEIATFPLAAIAHRPPVILPQPIFLQIVILSEAKDLLSTAPLLFRRGIALRLTRWSTLVPNFKPKNKQGAQ